jgi:hypothetical protein
MRRATVASGKTGFYRRLTRLAGFMKILQKTPIAAAGECTQPEKRILLKDLLRGQHNRAVDVDIFRRRANSK